MSEFEKDLKILEEKYADRYTDSFNIFSILHKKHDERRLHSRFIATLLNPNGSHGQGDRFLKEFVSRLDIKDFSFEQIDIYPKEEEKSEWMDIDIFIKSGDKILIIENKIFAGDSNKQIVEGEYQAQLLNYYEKVKKHFSLSDEVALQNVKLIYLTLNGKNPSLVEQLKSLRINLQLIDYIQFIPRWLQVCINDLEPSYLRDSIFQYLQLVKSITNDYGLAMKFRASIVEHMDQAYSVYLGGGNILFEQEFKHVKWHTVHEFWQEVGAALSESFDTTVRLPKDDLITAVTHRCTKRNLVLDFEYGGKTIYISNDSKGFTWGIIYNDAIDDSYLEGLIPMVFEIDGHKVWKAIGGLENVVFFDFTKRPTFDLIDFNLRRSIIIKIVDELKRYL